jgi:transcription antitermination factor NusG
MDQLPTTHNNPAQTPIKNILKNQKKMDEKKWYVVYTKPKWEKKIDALLHKKGVESWCPLNKIERQWSDRKKIIEEPLFKSYLFLHLHEIEKEVVRYTDGILNFVHFMGKPAVIKDFEIENIKFYLNEDVESIEMVATEGFCENSKVKVSRGVFMDYEGTVVKTERKKVYVKFDGIGNVMVIEFKAEHLQMA